jgi:hypothetical protein
MLRVSLNIFLKFIPFDILITSDLYILSNYPINSKSLTKFT